jgi:hypothetical protein
LVNVALVSREPYRAISRQYGLSKDALRRHSQEHIPQLLVKAQNAEESAQADDLLRQVRALQNKTLSLLLAAERAGDLRTALAGIREARGNLGLLAKLAGELDARPTVNVLIADHIAVAIVDALRPHPDAAVAVMGVLNELEGVPDV